MVFVWSPRPVDWLQLDRWVGIIMVPHALGLLVDRDALCDTVQGTNGVANTKTFLLGFGQWFRVDRWVGCDFGAICAPSSAAVV